MQMNEQLQNKNESHKSKKKNYVYAWCIQTKSMMKMWLWSLNYVSNWFTFVRIEETNAQPCTNINYGIFSYIRAFCICVHSYIPIIYMVWMRICISYSCVLLLCYLLSNWREYPMKKFYCKLKAPVPSFSVKKKKRQNQQNIDNNFCLN